MPRPRSLAVGFFHEILRHGVARREIENVVLHDPRRNDEHGLRLHRRGLRRVLDQLHEIVAHHDLAGGGGDIAADDELLGCGGSLAVEGALDVFQPVGEASHQVLAGFRPRCVQQLRIGEEIICGR